jgi:NAD(P)-dependent dehydrogenase (short-subunit alcohol dehydrogenase family)
MDYQDRQVVVTGGTGALGTAVVRALLEAGASCHVPVRSKDEEARFAFREHPQVQIYPEIDLTNEDQVDRLYRDMPALWASIHIAGGFAFGPVRGTTKVRLMQQIDTNLVSCFLCCRAAVNAFAAGKNGGRIVNVAARPALEWRTGANMTAYTASKAAVAALTVALAEEVVRDGIVVNAVAPSIMDTPANRAEMPRADFSAWPKVEEVARTILFLASPDNKVTRGAVVTVYGKA